MVTLFNEIIGGPQPLIQELCRTETSSGCTVEDLRRASLREEGLQLLVVEVVEQKSAAGFRW